MFAEIVSTIRAKIEADWTGAPVAWPNETFEPTAQLPWIYVEVQGNGASTTVFNSAGKRSARDDGLIFADVFVPIGMGTSDAYQTAEDFGAMFRAATLRGTGVAIAFESPSIGEQEPGDDNGLWFRISLSIPFSAFYAV